MTKTFIRVMLHRFTNPTQLSIFVVAHNISRTVFLEFLIWAIGIYLAFVFL